MRKELVSRIDEMFDHLVPASGKADTVAGEIIRAVCRIGYRWNNDGDMIGVGYGKETCNPPARFLCAKVDDGTARLLYKLIDGREWMPDDRYEERLDEVFAGVVAFLDAHPELESTPNEENMFSYEDPDEDYEDYDEDEAW